MKQRPSEIFFSDNSYLFLPTKKNPKVAIAVDSCNLVKNGFKLYNPFSLKAKKFKQIIMFLYLNFTILGKLFTTKKEKSDFIKFLEKKLNQPIITSIYFATIDDKVVLQLQSVDATILGYVKYPLNSIGLKHIENEIKALDLLSCLNIVEPYILCSTYKDKPFVFLKELKGDIGIVKREDIDSILDKFKTASSYRLVNHPRILGLKQSLLKNDMQEYISKIEKITLTSTIEYKLVYEHGDFAPWNIIQVKDNYVPFDFEYFVEDGLEYFDSIKYYYQIGKLLQNKDTNSLVAFICKEIKIKEIKALLALFLIKEIVRGKEESEPFVFEKQILEKIL